MYIDFCYWEVTNQAKVFRDIESCREAVSCNWTQRNLLLLFFSRLPRLWMKVITYWTQFCITEEVSLSYSKTPKTESAASKSTCCAICCAAKRATRPPQYTCEFIEVSFYLRFLPRQFWCSAREEEEERLELWAEGYWEELMVVPLEVLDSLASFLQPDNTSERYLGFKQTSIHNTSSTTHATTG